jgi:DegV family protein with EDD domain
MAVEIVTDSVSDLPPQVAADWGITVVPLTVSFGSEVFRDGIDLGPDQFYERLADKSGVFPTTAAPSPLAFAEVFDQLAEKTDEIAVLTISTKLSGTHEAALQGRTLKKKSCRVEVIDSQLATMGQGFIALKAAQAARSGASLDEVKGVIEKNIPRSEILAAFDTLEYLRRGGRIGAAKAYLGSMLNIHPLITLKDGVVQPAGRTRSRKKAIHGLFSFVAGYSSIEELAVEYTACREDAEALIDLLGTIYPKERIYRSRMTPVIGTHTGPGLLIVAVLGDRSSP